jgi:hypothetical protein
MWCINCAPIAQGFPIETGVNFDKMVESISTFTTQ